MGVALLVTAGFLVLGSFLPRMRLRDAVNAPLSVVVQCSMGLVAAYLGLGIILSVWNVNIIRMPLLLGIVGLAIVSAVLVEIYWIWKAK
jgi:hypothetical protein